MARGVGGKLVLLVVLLLIGGGVWFFRDLIPGPWKKEPVVVTEVSEAGAMAADAKLKRLREDGDTIRLSGIEFTSYMRYRMAPRFAADIELPTVAFAGDQVQVAGKLPKDRIPQSQIDQLGRAASFIPDTAKVEVGGGMRMLGPGRAALKVTAVAVESFPIPRSTYLTVLDRVGGMDEPGLERDEVAFQLPPGVGAARVENGELVLAPADRR